MRNSPESLIATTLKDDIYDGERPIREYTSTGAGVGWNIYGKGIDELVKRWASNKGWYYV